MSEARIKLIVTGDMEKLALHNSLKRFFPSKRNCGQNVIWETPRKLHCATSHRLVPLLSHQFPSKPMQALAQAMLVEARGVAKRGLSYDLVLVIDDVELHNLGQEAVVAAHFQAAVEAVLAEYSQNTQSRYRVILRDKCSFYLFRPMVEAYLFGDSNALRIAGVPAIETPFLVHPSDVEQFETNDPVWLSECCEENAKKHSKYPWWRHECHSKHYLEHLAERGCENYEETTHGNKALQSLDWKQVPKNSQDIPIIRSLFEDISDWFGINNPIGSGVFDPCFHPGHPKRRGLLLRNM